jgi:hypothetical protein
VHIADDRGVGRQKVAPPHRSRHIAAESFEGGALRVLAWSLWCATLLLCGCSAADMRPPSNHCRPTTVRDPLLPSRLPFLDSPFPPFPRALPSSPVHYFLPLHSHNLPRRRQQANGSLTNGVGRREGARGRGGGGEGGKAEKKQGGSHNLPSHHRATELGDYGPRQHVLRERTWWTSLSL